MSEATEPATSPTPSESSVFLVASGEYSAYQIHSVWSTREAAEAAAGTWAEVEEWLLNETRERTITEWRAWIDTRTGVIMVADRAIETASPGATRVRTYRRRDGSPYWEGHGFGPSPEHARKALSDALAKAKAESLDDEAAQ